MAKTIAMFFDGTWNMPDTDEVDGDQNTNAYKISNIAVEDDQQKIKYFHGLGTKWYEKYRGGVFGVGLSEKIQEGYKFLIEEYEDGDHVFLFGFSRGAYTARSLVGLIRNSGLIDLNKITSDNSLENVIGDAYSLYRSRDDGADSRSAIFFRKKFSKEIKIKFLGVWDTVGSCGIPFDSFNWFNKKYYDFHDTELSSIVENAFHAIAIDEHRKNYAPTLWDPKEKPNQKIEQVWFVGAHCNVGGGYSRNNLSDIPLSWMLEKATECGLRIHNEKAPSAELNINNSIIMDSYSTFLNGAFSRFNDRYYRPIGITELGNEILHDSVSRYLDFDKSYNPKNRIDKFLSNNKKLKTRIRWFND